MRVWQLLAFHLGFERSHEGELAREQLVRTLIRQIVLLITLTFKRQMRIQTQASQYSHPLWSRWWSASARSVVE